MRVIASAAGYSITVGGPSGCKKPCVIALKHSGLQTAFMAVLDQNELNMWFNALEKGTKEKRVGDMKSSYESQTPILLHKEVPRLKMRVEEVEGGVQQLQVYIILDIKHFGSS